MARGGKTVERIVGSLVAATEILSLRNQGDEVRSTDIHS